MRGVVGGGGVIGPREQHNSGGLRNEVWKVCSVFRGFARPARGLSSTWTQPHVSPKSLKLNGCPLIKTGEPRGHRGAL